MLSSGSKTSPIVVRLSGHAQTNDRLAIREMGKQIAEAEGRKMQVADDEEQADAVEEVRKNPAVLVIADRQEYAPTTLPSHLLALLTVPSPRAIIIIIEEFDLFTEHARQALLYCLRTFQVPSSKVVHLSSTDRLVDVVQSVKTGPVDTTGRGVAVIGVTSRVVSSLPAVPADTPKTFANRFRIHCYYLKNESNPDSHIACSVSCHPWLPRLAGKDYSRVP